MRRTDRNRLIERCAAIADQRAKVSAEAVARYMGEEQYDMAATERCAASEARYIAVKIRALQTPE